MKKNILIVFSFLLNINIVFADFLPAMKFEVTKPARLMIDQVFYSDHKGWTDSDSPRLSSKVILTFRNSMSTQVPESSSRSSSIWSQQPVLINESLLTLQYINRDRRQVTIKFVPNNRQENDIQLPIGFCFGGFFLSGEPNSEYKHWTSYYLSHSFQIQGEMNIEKGDLDEFIQNHLPIRMTMQPNDLKSFSTTVLGHYKDQILRDFKMDYLTRGNALKTIKMSEAVKGDFVLEGTPLDLKMEYPKMTLLLETKMLEQSPVGTENVQ